MGKVSVHGEKALPTDERFIASDKRRMETIASYEAVFANTLTTTYSIEKGKAELMAHELVGQLIHVHGGTTMVIPSAYWRRTRERERCVLAAFNGSNAGELAKEHGMTERGIYKIVERDRLRRIEAKKANSL